MAGEPGKLAAWFKTYQPLLLILGLIAVASFAGSSWMMSFMAGFFIVFGAFKLLDVSAFANAYARYDIIAKALQALGVCLPVHRDQHLDLPSCSISSDFSDVDCTHPERCWRGWRHPIRAVQTDNSMCVPWNSFPAPDVDGHHHRECWHGCDGRIGCCSWACDDQTLYSDCFWKGSRVRRAQSRCSSQIRRAAQAHTDEFLCACRLKSQRPQCKGSQNYKFASI